MCCDEYSLSHDPVSHDLVSHDPVSHDQAIYSRCIPPTSTLPVQLFTLNQTRPFCAAPYTPSDKQFGYEWSGHVRLMIQLVNTGEGSCELIQLHSNGHMTRA